LQVHADRYLPGTVDSYPTGEIADVTGTEMDFRMARKISANVPPLDNNFCLSDRVRPVTDALTLTGAKGVSLKVATDQTGIQVFDNRPDYAGLAIEAQSWPDAPNNRDFPSILVTRSAIDADVAVVGAPFDFGTQWRPGARFGPRSIREASTLFAFGHAGAYDHEDDVTYLGEGTKIVDIGDADIVHTDTEKSHANIESSRLYRSSNSHSANRRAP